MYKTNDKFNFIGNFKLRFSTINYISEKTNKEKSISAKFALLKYVSD